MTMNRYLVDYLRSGVMGLIIVLSVVTIGSMIKKDSPAEERPARVIITRRTNPRRLAAISAPSPTTKNTAQTPTIPQQTPCASSPSLNAGK